MKRRMMKQLAAIVTAAVTAAAGITFPVTARPEQAAAEEVFFDDFSGNSLDRDKWLIAQKAWGGQNAGVIPENVSVADGRLILEGHGDLYTGTQKGVTRDGTYINQTTRVGGAIATREYYGSGSYEVRAKVAPELGACSAIWTFEYEEYYKGEEGYKGTGSYYAVNHEIDIEMPGRPASSHVNQSFNYALCNTWEGEKGGEYTTNYTDIGYPQNDGQFHTYRFDWHTGDADQTKRVEFYFDGNLVYTSYKNIPTNEGRLWIGLWFPNGWAGSPAFDTTQFEVDYVKIVPFHEAGDTPQHETYGRTGWASDTIYEADVVTSDNLLLNGDFAAGTEGWDLSGGAQVADGRAILASGSNTDTIKQTIEVQPGATYKLIVDAQSAGADLEVGVEDYNGRYTKLNKVVTGKETVELTFTVAAWMKQITVYANVVRYQKNKENCYVNQFYLTSDLNYEAGAPAETEPETEVPTETEPETTAPAIIVNNLIQNPTFQGSSSWKASGSVVFEPGRAVLASGRDTDRIKQTVAVTSGKTYRLTAKVTSTGAAIEIGVDDYNGKYTTLSETLTADGTVELTFTVASHMKQISVFAEVLRYQDNGENCTVTDFVLTEVQ